MLLLVLLLLLLQLVLVLLVLLRELLLVLRLELILCLSGGMQRGGQEVEHIVVIGQATRGGRDAKVSVLGQIHAIRPQTQLVVIVVVGHSIVDEHGEYIVVVLDARPRREGLVAEIAEATAQKLRGSIVGMVIELSAIVKHRTDVGIVVLVVVVEGVEHDGQTVPAVRGPKDRPIVVALLRGVPEGQAIGSDTATSRYPEHDLHVPPVEVRLRFRPDGTLLGAQRWRHAHTFRTGDGICNGEQQVVAIETPGESCSNRN